MANESQKKVEQIPVEKKKGSFSRLMVFMKPYRGRFILGILCILLQVVAFALGPMFMGQAIDGMSHVFGWNSGNVTTAVESAASQFNTSLIMMVVVYLCTGIFAFFATALLIGASENTIYDLRAAINRKLAKLPLNYYDTHTYGDILSRVTNDVTSISNSLQQSIYQILKAVFTVAFLLYMMLSINGVLTILGILVIPIALIIATKLTKKSQKAFDIQQEKTGEINGYVEEYYSGHNVVMLFNREDTVVKEFDEINQQLFKAGRDGSFLANVLTPLMQNTTNLGHAIVALVGSLMAIYGGLTVGTIQAFTQYLTQMAASLTELMSIASVLQTSQSAADRIFEFLDEEEEVPDADPGKFPAKLEGKVEFDHVRFGYLPHRTLIHDLDITVNPGEKTAIVGPTGAGKTTLVNLIMRFYDVRGGAIRIDGVDVRDMKRERLREIFGMVLQETWLYAGTVMENIRYGKLDATDEEVIDAAKRARADAFIRTLPGGYNFMLQEGASNIAQGQRQLLTIARALLSDPPIMILDEATSSVDTRTELLIQSAMMQMMQGHTSFIIAHRLSTIRDAAKIMYMQDGDILEIGNHDELMAKNGYYAKLYNSQFAENNG